jgi:virginiamycin A acetyltransferase
MMNLISKIRSRLFPEDEFTSIPLRNRFRDLYEINVGLYSYGCFDADRIGRRTTIGRYCSFAPTAHIYRRNHGVEFLGLTAYFYNRSLGVVDNDTISYRPLEVMDDVWLGHNSVILPSVSKIGRGSVIGAGSVVSRDVEPYSIVVGNAAKPIRKRFSDEIIDKIERSKWWELSPSELRKVFELVPDFVQNPATAPDEVWQIIDTVRSSK